MNSKEEINKLNIEVGTVEFWVRENKVSWNDYRSNPLFELSKSGNSIFIVKDSDNKLKFFHVYLGKGRTDVEIDVSDLGDDRAHHVVATWDVNGKKICLYINGGEKRSCSDIVY